MVSANSPKRIKKHKDDMINLAVEYKKLSEQFRNTDDEFANYLVDRSALATQAAVIDIIWKFYCQIRDTQKYIASNKAL